MSDLKSRCCLASYHPKVVWENTWQDEQGKSHTQRMIVSACDVCHQECDVIAAIEVKEPNA